METCSVLNCGRAIYRQTLCRRHHYRKSVHGDPEAGGPIRNTGHAGSCSLPGCQAPYLAKGLCAAHYQKRRLYGDPLYQEALAKDQPCSVRGCKAKQIAKGFCSKHYQRARTHGDPEVSLRREVGKGGISSCGYRVLYRPGHPNAAKTGRIFEHRLIMAEVLGRPLLSNETVHHKNGNRLDNRPENLELWVGYHSDGQRVEDLVEWAREVLRIYGELAADTKA